MLFFPTATWTTALPQGFLRYYFANNRSPTFWGTCLEWGLIQYSVLKNGGKNGNMIKSSRTWSWGLGRIHLRRCGRREGSLLCITQIETTLNWWSTLPWSNQTVYLASIGKMGSFTPISSESIYPMIDIGNSRDLQHRPLTCNSWGLKTLSGLRSGWKTTYEDASSAHWKIPRHVDSLDIASILELLDHTQSPTMVGPRA